MAPCDRRALAQRPVEVGEEVVDVFETDRQPDHPVADTDRGTGVGRQAPVGGGCRMGDEALRIAEVVRDVEQPQTIEKGEGRVLATVEIDGEERASIELSEGGHDLTLFVQDSPYLVVQNVPVVSGGVTDIRIFEAADCRLSPAGDCE